MKKSIILLFLLLIFVTSCSNIDLSKISDEDVEKITGGIIVCNKPYIRYGASCCLDANNNSICDNDDVSGKEELINDVPEKIIVEEIVVIEDEIAAEIPEEVIEEPQPVVEETVAAPEPEPVVEPIITTYSKVSVVINKVERNWFIEFGKITTLHITQLHYTINNDEEGTIKPGSFKMLVEGYTDESSQKVVPLSVEQQTIKSGQKVSASVEVPNGFVYSSETAGDLENVRVSIIMFDLDGKAMASYSNEFDLSG